MPEYSNFARRKLVREGGPAEAIPKASFVELGLSSPFSFLRGASDAIELALTRFGERLARRGLVVGKRRPLTRLPNSSCIGLAALGFRSGRSFRSLGTPLNARPLGGRTSA
jgi:hypothetical protein